jgi:CrcB protein
MRRVAITVSRVACAQSRLLEVRMQLFPAPAQVAGRLLPIAVALVAAGGAIGATARWLVGTLLKAEPAAWPWSTLCVNVVGCVLIGVAARHIERGSQRWDFIVTGLLGGFTTMSSFAVELNDLVDAGRSGMAFGYGATTVVAGMGIITLMLRGPS